MTGDNLTKKDTAKTLKKKGEAEVCQCDDRVPHLDSTDGMIYCLECGGNIRQLKANN